MGLRQFHVVFIAVSGGLCLWLAGWGAAHRGETQGAVLAGVGAGGFVALAGYLRNFLKRRPHGPAGALVAGLVAGAASDVRACATCMGQLDGPTGRAYFWGIAFLAALVLATLGGLASMMIRAARDQEKRFP